MWRFLTIELEGPRITYPQVFFDAWPEERYPVRCPTCGCVLRRKARRLCPDCGRSYERNEVIAGQYLRDDERVAEIIGTPWLKWLNCWHHRVFGVWTAAAVTFAGVGYFIFQASSQVILGSHLSGDALGAALNHHFDIRQALNLFGLVFLLAHPLSKWWIRVMRRRAIRRHVREMDGAW